MCRSDESQQVGVTSDKGRARVGSSAQSKPPHPEDASQKRGVIFTQLRMVRATNRHVPEKIEWSWWKMGSEIIEAGVVSPRPLTPPPTPVSTS